MKWGQKRFGRNDRNLLGAILLVFAAVFAWQFFFGGECGTQVRITVAGQIYGTYFLNEDQTVEIRMDGVVTNVLVIRDKEAKMASAGCPDQICVHHLPIKNRGETIVCLPNRITAEVLGGTDSDVDSVVGKGGA